MCDKASLIRSHTGIRTHQDLEKSVLGIQQEKIKRFFLQARDEKKLIFLLNTKTPGAQNHEVASKVMQVI